MIKLSSKWDYAIKAVIYLLNNDTKWLINIKEIAKNEKISESLLRRIVADLEKAWVLKTVKWRNWGIYIWRDLKDISLYDILIASWEDLGIKDCSSWLKCDKNHDCNVFYLYNELQKWFNWILKLYTLDKIKKKA